MEHSFDCIVMDPPWENKSVKRGGKYPTVASRQLLSLPVPSLLKQANTLLTCRHMHQVHGCEGSPSTLEAHGDSLVMLDLDKFGVHE